MGNNILDFLQAKQSRSGSSLKNPNRTMHLVLGSICLFWGLTAPKGGRLRTIAGTSLLACGILDIDPVKASSTIANKVGTKDNLFNIVKSFLPGQGIEPRYTDQAIPQKHKNSKNSIDTRTLKEMLTIG